MNLNLTGNHLDITPAMRDYVVAKLDRVTRHFDHVIDVNVVLVGGQAAAQGGGEPARARQGHPLSRRSRPTCTRRSTCSIDKLDRQVVKHKEKRAGTATKAPAIKRDVPPPTCRSRRPPARPGPPTGSCPRGRPTSARDPSPRPDEPDRRAAARGEHPARPRRRIEGATVRRGRRAVRDGNGADARCGRRQPARAREAGLDGPGPGHRDSARPHQGAARSAGRVRAPASRRSRSTRPTASRSRRCSCCSCPSRRPSSTCSSCPSSRRCSPSKRFREAARRRAPTLRRCTTLFARLGRASARRRAMTGPRQHDAAGQRREILRRQRGAARTCAGSPGARAATAC